jgi:hypothetical protein
MRTRAQANGHLQTNRQESVTTENQDGQQAIQIQPADPQVIYVPAYDPYYVYGWGDYPPLYYPDGYWYEPGINIGFYFGGWGGWGFGGWGWGWGPNWFGRSVFINNGFFNRYGYRGGVGFAGGIAGRSAWAHDPAHRLGASYPGSQLNSRFGAASQASRIAAGRSGNWHSFGQGNAGSANSFRGSSATPQAGVRGAQAFQGSTGTERFSGGQSYRAPASTQRSAAPTQRSGSSYQAPQRSFQSAPRMSAPSYGGGGASRSFGGGGGGGGHSSGGHGGGGRR